MSYIEHLLTERQVEIFLLFGKGNTAAEISALLCISKKTVWSHRRDIMDRMGYKRAYHLTYNAIKYEIYLQQGET